MLAVWTRQPRPQGPRDIQNGGDRGDEFENKDTFNRNKDNNKMLNRNYKNLQVL